MRQEQPHYEIEGQDEDVSDEVDVHKLMRAVLSRALRDAYGYEGSTAEMRRSAGKWFRSKSRVTFSFLWVAEGLGLCDIVIKRCQVIGTTGADMPAEQALEVRDKVFPHQAATYKKERKRRKRALARVTVSQASSQTLDRRMCQ